MLSAARIGRAPRKDRRFAFGPQEDKSILRGEYGARKGHPSPVSFITDRVYAGRRFVDPIHHGWQQHAADCRIPVLSQRAVIGPEPVLP